MRRVALRHLDALWTVERDQHVEAAAGQPSRQDIPIEFVVLDDQDAFHHALQSKMRAVRELDLHEGGR